MEERQTQIQAAIMFTDLVRYTGLSERDEPAALDLVKKNRELHTTTINKHKGARHFFEKRIGGLLVNTNGSHLHSFGLSEKIVRFSRQLTRTRMTMKIFITLISILTTLLFASCEDDRLKLPQVTSDPMELTLTSGQLTAQVLLYSNDNGAFEISWEITHRPDWLEVSSEKGLIPEIITVTALADNLLVGTYQDNITIHTTTNHFAIPVTLVVSESNAVRFDPEELLLTKDENSKTVTLKNFSNQTVNWELIPSESFLSVTPASGSLNPNQSVNLTVNVDRANLDSKVYSESLTLKVDGLESSDLPVTISNLFLLESQVIDAEYNRAGDNLIIVTSDMSLLKVNPVTQTFTAVTLSKLPTCVSVGMNGAFAVVGHEDEITLVDLINMEIEETYPISTTAVDVVLAPNNWAYVFPLFDQWVYIHCINLATGEEMLSTSIRAGTKAKLHPSGNYIYGANNGLIPNDAEKYDIQNGLASYLYDSPYHGHYEFFGDLWIADDGSKMYTRSRNIFSLSTDRNLDMIYSGAIPGEVGIGIKSLDHHSVANRVGVITVDYSQWQWVPADEIKIYSADALNPIATIPLSDFVVNSTTEGHYVFFNAAGSKLVVILKADLSNTDEDSWGVTTMDIN